ncbi:MAG: two-component regulator propeller domain-containing protein, partial [Bacteroidota bacterium]
KLDPATGVFTRGIDDPDSLDTDIRALNYDQAGNLWLGKYNGITVIDEDQETVSRVSESSGLTKSSIKSLYTDKKGSVWVGTYHGGVSLWDELNNNFRNLDETALNYDIISALATDAQKNLYFATEGNGVTVLDSRTGKSRIINAKRYSGLSGNHIKSLLLTDDRLLWIGTFKDGVNLYDISERKIVNHLLNPQLIDLVRETGVYAIEQMVADEIWLGTFGEGVIRYNLRTKEFQQFRRRMSSESSLSSNLVRTMLIDRENIWVGTRTGLNLLRPTDSTYRSDQWKHFFLQSDSEFGEDILTLFQDTQGKIWVGTKAKGLFFHDGQGFSPVESSSPEILITSVHAILEDDSANLWLSTNQGIVKYNTDHQSFTLYNQADGLTNAEFSDNAALKVGDNHFYFGGASGVTFFNPEKVMTNHYTPSVLFTDFKINNESVEAGREQQVLDQSITYTDALTLAHNQANFSIAYALPNFINPGNNKYKYRLIGLEDRWTTTSQTEVTYIIQNPGTYTFEVIGANNDGIWNENITSLAIKIRPAPWRSGWALAGYVLIALAILYVVIRLVRYYALLRLQLDLDQLAIQRNEEVHQEKMQFFTNISHDFKTPLTLIMGALEQVLSDYRGSNRMYRKLLVVERSAHHLLKLVNRLMDFRKLENDHLGLQSAKGNLVKFTKEIYLSFVEFAKDRDYTYTFHASNDEILVYFDRDKLERVFYNLISNAFRYTPR